ELKAARVEAEEARTAAEARARDAEAKAREAEQARRQAAQGPVKAQGARAQSDAEQAKNAALLKELADLKGQQTNRGLVLTVGDVLFATGKAEVAAGGIARLRH